MIGKYAYRLSYAMIIIGAIGLYDHFFEEPSKAPGLAIPLIFIVVGVIASLLLRDRE